MLKPLALTVALILAANPGRPAVESPCHRDLSRDPIIIAAVEQGRIDVARVDFGNSGIAAETFEADGFFIVQIDEQVAGEQAEVLWQSVLCRIRGRLAGDL